jgi:GDPmannose 4,6-dehydratase
VPVVLVTGVNGQDGSYLADLLVAEGSQVHGLDRHSSDERGLPSGRNPAVTYHSGDLSDPALIPRLVDLIEPDEIYHLAGVSSVAFSWSEPLLTLEVTGMGAARVMEAAWDAQQRTGRPIRVLQASSSEIFGAPDRSPQDELTPLRPRSPYGAAKALAHQLVDVYRTRGLHAVAVILYNHESPRRPTDFVTRKITQAVAGIAGGSQEILELGDMSARRDWGWAPDYVDAMVRAIRHPVPSDYVIATGISHSVEDFVVCAFGHVGIGDWDRWVRSDPSLHRPTDTQALVGNPTRAHEILGWQPTVSFEEVVRRMVDADLGVTP